MSPARTDATLAAESPLELEARIRSRAHEIWDARGGEPGAELDDWLQAEREILGEQKDTAQDGATVAGSAKKSRTASH